MQIKRVIKSLTQLQVQYCYIYLTFDAPWIFTSLGVKVRQNRAAPGNSLALLLSPANKTILVQNCIGQIYANLTVHLNSSFKVNSNIPSFS